MLEAIVAGIVAIVIAVGGFFGGIWREKLSQSRSASASYDRQLLKKFNDTFPIHQRQFLRTHHFGNSFDRRLLFGIYDLAENWHGADFEFIDKKVQKTLKTLCDESAKLADLTSLYTYPSDTMRNLATPKTTMDTARGISEKTHARIEMMNSASQRTVQALDKFVNASKKFEAPDTLNEGKQTDSIKAETTS